MNRRSLPLLLQALVILFLGSATLHAHAQAKLAVYGTVGAEKNGQANVGWTGAGTLGLYFGLHNLGPLAFSADARADLASTIKSGLVGPRLALHLPAFPIKPYAEVLIGVTTYPSQPNGIKPANRFAGRAVGGIDTTILPRVDWRIIDFSYGIDHDFRPETLSTGLVLRF
jgi:hypothetical protein